MDRSRTPQLVEGNTAHLLQGGIELFPRMITAIDKACFEIWVVTYIFNVDPATTEIVAALKRAADRGVPVRILVDGYGSRSMLPVLRRLFQGSTIALEDSRPLPSWSTWLQPQQLGTWQQ